MIRHYEQSKRLNELEVISHTLDAMRHGGLWDHIGGGFHRYSTDQRWLLPHFEKMLYDNAQLVRAYTDGYRLSGRDDYKRVVADIFTWVRREMTDPAGGFYSAQDADSPVDHGSHETEEGKYYVWTPQQVIEVLGETDGKLFNRVYGIVEGGNFEDEAKGAKTGDSIPHLAAYLPDTAEQLKIEEEALRKRLGAMRDKLLAARLKRPRPHLDDKVLVGWNGLMIGSLAHAGHHLKVEPYIEAAEAAADFILKNLRDEKGRLKRTWRKGTAKGTGYLTDYAYFAEALLDLHTATGEPRWLEAAESIAGHMIEGFADPSGGGFYFTSDRHEKLLVRAKNLGGGGNMPDANGVASRVLLELAVRSKKPKHGQRAAAALQAHAGMMWRRPYQAEQMILATDRLFTLIEQKKLPELAQATGDTDADAVERADPLTYELFVSAERARPGDSLEAAVRIGIRPPYHIYAHEPGNDVVIPTTVRLEAEGATAGKIRYPDGESVFDKAIDGKVVTHKDRVLVRVPLKIDPDAKGPVVLKFTVRAQPCDDQMCLMPIEKTLQFTVQVSAEADAEARHPELFKNRK